MQKSNRLRILAVSSVTWQHGIQGGMERYFDLITRGLAELGHAVTIVTTRMPRGIPPDGKIRFRVLPVATDSRGKDWRRELRHFCRPAGGADVVLSNSFAAYPLAQSPPAPIVAIVHGTGLVDMIGSLRLFVRGRNSLLATLKRVLRFTPASYLREWRLVSAAAAIVAGSREVQANVGRTYGVAPQKFFVVHSPEETDIFHPPGEGPLRGAPLRILSAATLSRQKGFDYLLEALAILHRRRPDAYHLTIVGAGPELNRLQENGRRLGVASSLTFAGALSLQDLAEAFRAADLFALATVREEGFPVVISEALASGVPVVGTRAGGVQSAVLDGIDGKLVPPAQPAALADAIEELAVNPELRRRMGARARARALRELDWRKSAVTVEQILQSVASPTFCGTH